MVMYMNILHVLSSLACPKLYNPSSTSHPTSMVSIPLKNIIFDSLGKPALPKRCALFPPAAHVPIQTRAALEKENLWEGQ